jgi:hypothetical protein
LLSLALRGSFGTIADTVRGLLAIALVAATQTVSAPIDDTPVRVSCPKGRETRIVLPEPLLRLRAPGQDSPLDLTVEHTRPQGVLRVVPRTHPARATLEVRGATRSLRLVIETAALGESGEVRIEFAAEATPSAPPVVASPPPPSPTVEPPAPTTPPAPTRAEGALDPVELLRAKVVLVGDREGLPGHPAMILTDALQGERWVWFRFLLEGGAGARVARVSWEGGPVENATQEAQGKDLRVIVPLQRAGLTRRAHLTLEVEQGATYTFALNTRALRALIPET